LDEISSRYINSFLSIQKKMIHLFFEVSVMSYKKYFYFFLYKNNKKKTIMSFIQEFHEKDFYYPQTVHSIFFFHDTRYRTIFEIFLRFFF